MEQTLYETDIHTSSVGDFEHFRPNVQSVWSTTWCVSENNHQVHKEKGGLVSKDIVF